MAAPRKTTAKKKTAVKKTAKKTRAKKAVKKRKYSPAASEKVADVMDEMKAGKLHSGRSNKKVTDRKQAIAIGLSEARAAGKKVPPNPNRRKTSS